MSIHTAIRERENRISWLRDLFDRNPTHEECKLINESIRDVRRELNSLRYKRSKLR